MSFQKNVFINCPFDSDYRNLLKPIIFTIKKSGLIPRIASERFDSGEVRFDKISELILESKYSIHDLSRNKSSVKKEYYRLNMPFELGVDLGCKIYNPIKKYRNKKFLILESEKYSVQKALSDYSFADCKCHQNDSETLVALIRNWFVETGLMHITPPSKIWDEYNLFQSTLYTIKKSHGFSVKDISEITIPEYIQFINEYLSK